jgi:hypothetical protein
MMAAEGKNALEFASKKELVFTSLKEALQSIKVICLLDADRCPHEMGELAKSKGYLLFYYSCIKQPWETGFQRRGGMNGSDLRGAFRSPRGPTAWSFSFRHMQHFIL